MRKTVLIADDNAFVRTALYEIFEREPDFHVCEVAEDGRDAIDKARRVRPDLIVLDIAMPVMNGLDAARVLKQIMPAVPLIIYSASANPVFEQAARSIGIAGLISKSEKVSVLVNAVRGVLYPRAA
jgi:DNA-binding NarL/FixJ family response regulator